MDAIAAVTSMRKYFKYLKVSLLFAFLLWTPRVTAGFSFEIHWLLCYLQSTAIVDNGEEVTAATPFSHNCGVAILADKLSQLPFRSYAIFDSAFVAAVIL